MREACGNVEKAFKIILFLVKLILHIRYFLSRWNAIPTICCVSSRVLSTSVKQHPIKPKRKKKMKWTLFNNMCTYWNHILDAIRLFIRLRRQWALLSPKLSIETKAIFVFRFSNYFPNRKPYSIRTENNTNIFHRYLYCCLLLSIEYWSKAIALIWYLKSA